jgi:hypothetical protein
MAQLRYWLIDLPAQGTDILAKWYRLYMLIVLSIAGPGCLLMVLTTLILWFGFGIRWGW